MLIIGCDFHPGFQQVAIFDNQTGEYQEKRLSHRQEAEQFYRSLAGQKVRVGMEACGHYPWFERLLADLGLELWLGDAAKIRASVVRKRDKGISECNGDVSTITNLWIAELVVEQAVEPLGWSQVRQVLLKRYPPLYRRASPRWSVPKQATRLSKAHSRIGRSRGALVAFPRHSRRSALTFRIAGEERSMPQEI